MATEVFVLRLEQKGAKQAAQGIKQVGENSQKAVRILQVLRNLLVALAFLRAASHAVAFVDSLKEVQNNLTQVTRSTKELADAQKFLFDQSKQNRTGLKESSDLYVRLSKALKPLGASEETVRQTTDSLTKAIRLSGMTLRQASNDMERFAGELARGAPEAEMMQNIVERYPRIAESIGKHFNTAAGSLEEFVKNNPGLVTTQEIIKAIEADAANLTEEFSRLQGTLSEALTHFMEQLKQYIGASPAAVGSTNAIANAFFVMGDNMNVVMGALTALITLIGVQLAQTAIPAAITAIKGFNLAVTASPIAGFATALGLGAAAAIAFAEPLSLMTQGMFGLEEPINSTIIGIGLIASTITAKFIPAIIGAKASLGLLAVGTSAAMFAMFDWRTAIDEGSFALIALQQTLALLPALIALATGHLGAFVAVLASPILLGAVAFAAAFAAAWTALGGTWEEFTAVVRKSIDWIKSWFAEGTVLGKLLGKVKEELDKATESWEGKTEAVQDNNKAMEDATKALEEYHALQRKLEKEAQAIYDESRRKYKEWSDSFGDMANSANSASNSVSKLNSQLAKVSSNGGGGSFSGGGSGGGGGSSGGGSSGGSGKNFFDPSSSGSDFFAGMGGMTSTISIDMKPSEEKFQAERDKLTSQALHESLKSITKMIDSGEIEKSEAQKAYDAVFAAADDFASGGSPTTLAKLSLVSEKLTKSFEGLINQTISTGEFIKFRADPYSGYTGSPTIRAPHHALFPGAGGVDGGRMDIFAKDGGVFEVPGSTASKRDSVLAKMMLDPGEEVHVIPRKKSSHKDRDKEGGVTQNINVTLNLPETVTDAMSFKRTQAQIEADLARVVQRAGAKGAR